MFYWSTVTTCFKLLTVFCTDFCYEMPKSEVLAWCDVVLHRVSRYGHNGTITKFVAVFLSEVRGLLHMSQFLKSFEGKPPGTKFVE